MQTITKYFFIIICCLYVYRKLLNINFSKKLIFNIFIFAITSSLIANFIRTTIAPLTLITIFVLTTFFTYIVYKKSFKITLSFSVISIVISYILFLIALVITSPLNYLIFLKIHRSMISNFVSSFIFGSFQLLFSFLLFRIKRFKNGVPFLEKKTFSDIGTSICIFLLLIASLFYINNDNLMFFALLIFIVICSSVVILLWWRSLITNSYLEKLNKRENERYEKTIETQQEEIDKLKLHNDALAKIIHKDNKLIPAMELAVKEFLCNASLDNSELTTTANSLIKQLEALASERKGIINRYELSSKTLTKTGVGSTDAVMKYLLHRANEANILFDLTVTGNIRYLISSIISENDLNTLISDLGENALIAAKEAGKGSVFITLGIDGEDYCLSIYDNGPYFNADVIKNLGKSRYTTHILTGGSGIGLMTTFELLRKYNASFEIDENIVHEVFKKCVSVRFDSCSRLRIKSSREEIAKIFDMSYSLTDTYEPGCFEANINGSIQKL